MEPLGNAKSCVARRVLLSAFGPDHLRRFDLFLFLDFILSNFAKDLSFFGIEVMGFFFRESVVSSVSSQSESGMNWSWLWVSERVCRH